MSERGAPPGPKSSLADTGVVLGVVALATCGVFSPIALVVSLAALRGEDRRRAWIGVALALAATAEFAAAVWALSRLDAAPR